MKNKRKLNILILTAVICILFLSCNSESLLGSYFTETEYNQYICLQGGTLIDGNGGTPIPDATVIIKDSLIIYAGSSSSAIIPDSSTIIDAGGKTILPGFFNAHVHYSNNTHRMRTWLLEGVTTVRDLAIPTNSRIEIIQTMNSEPSSYFPRMIYASPIFDIAAGVPHGSYGVIVSSPENAIVRTNQYIDLGVDLIKVYLDERDNYNSMPLEYLQAIVETAHSRNMRVVVHAQEAHLYYRALEGNADEIVHPMIYETTPDSLVDRLIADDVGVISSLEIYQYPPMRQQAMENINKLHQRGVKIALGSDFDIGWPMDEGMPITELRLLEQAGLTPMEVIVTATKNAAEFCELGDNLGTIETGKIADVILVNGNPLDDLQVLKSNLYMVIHNGIVVKDNLD
ncbi:MAG: amidohydrolase family protein [Ignavibacteria bacterium]|jgi:imidazolonepropionase-like amidohydrolase